MSLTLPTAYSNSSKLGNIQENWIVQLGFFNGDAQGSGEGGWDAVLRANGTANLLTADVNNSTTTIPVDDGTVFAADDYLKIESEIVKVVSISSNNLTVVRTQMGTSLEAHEDDDAIYWNNFTPISLADTTIDDVFYHGTITNVPSIRSSIDLASSTAKTGNISLNVINFQFKGDDFSAELFLGTRKYINRDVKIYSQLNGDTTLANCLQIYQGRLIDISHDDSTVTLQLTEQRPWDFITIPQDKTTVKKQFIPVVYGAFTDNANNHSAQGYVTSKDLWEMPNVSDTGDNVMGLSFQALDGTAGSQEARLHVYEKGADIFPAISTADGGTSYNDSTKAHDGQHVSYVKNNLYRGFTTKPLRARTNDDGDSDAAFDTPTADETSTESSIVHTLSVTGSPASDTEYYRWECPHINGKVTLFTMIVNYAVTTTGTANYSSGGGDVGFSYSLGNNTVIGGSTDTTTIVAHTNRTVTAQGNSGTIAMTSEVASNGYKLPDYIEIKSYINEPSSGNAGQITASVKIYDVRLKIKTEEVFDDGKNKEKSQEVRLFCGANGYANSFTGGSGTADTGLEAHRDLLFRFTGFDDTDANIYNYDDDLDIEAARITTAWNIRWWSLKPIELKKILEQIQYEFCFIFKWRHDGTGSYWFIKDSYSSSEATLKASDISNLKIVNTPFSGLLTDMRISYEKHPAESRYLSSQTSKDTTNNPRTVWNIQSKENIKEVNLDMNVNKPGNTNVGGNDPNDGFADYYMNIFGDIKKIVNCDIVNPAISYNLETGDIIQFSNTAGEMPVEPFGDNWADYYMITDLKRSPGKVSITAREVG